MGRERVRVRDASGHEEDVLASPLPGGAKSSNKFDYSNKALSIPTTKQPLR